MPLITDLLRIKHKKGSFYLDLNEWQGAKKVSFTVCHSGKLEHVLAHKSFQLTPKPFLICRIDYHPSVI